MIMRSVSRWAYRHLLLWYRSVNSLSTSPWHAFYLSLTLLSMNLLGWSALQDIGCSLMLCCPYTLEAILALVVIWYWFSYAVSPNTSEYKVPLMTHLTSVVFGPGSCGGNGWSCSAKTCRYCRISIYNAMSLLHLFFFGLQLTRLLLVHPSNCKSDSASKSPSGSLRQFYLGIIKHVLSERAECENGLSHCPKATSRQTNAEVENEIDIRDRWCHGCTTASGGWMDAPREIGMTWKF